MKVNIVYPERLFIEIRDLTKLISKHKMLSSMNVRRYLFSKSQNMSSNLSFFRSVVTLELQVLRARDPKSCSMS